MVDADIEGGLDHISQDHPLGLIGSFPAQGLIRQWLNARYVGAEGLHPMPVGTPQDGVASPLLANIALYGMEEALGIHRRKPGGIDRPRTDLPWLEQRPSGEPTSVMNPPVLCSSQPLNW